MDDATRHAADPTTQPLPLSKRRVMAGAYFLLFLGPGIALPYLPRYLEHLGMSDPQIGVLIGLQPILRWTSALAFAHVADRWRIRHRLLVATTVAGTVFFLPILAVRSFDALLLVLCAINILHGPLISAIDAIVLDHLPQLGGDYGRLRLWGSISFILGALLGAISLIPRLVPPARSTSGQALYGITGFGIGGSTGIALAGLLVAPLGTTGLFVFQAALAAAALPAAVRLVRLRPR
jgi:PPP family 3-phenylpropionic acid transporter